MTLIIFLIWFLLGSVLFRHVLKVKKSCGTTIVLLIFAIVGTSGTQEGLDWYEDWYAEWKVKQEQRIAEKKAQEKQRAVIAFLAEINPQLSSKFQQIQVEIKNIDDKIQKISDLKKEFPNMEKMIEKPLNQWQTLRFQLNQVSQHIYQKVEKTYVIYRIDEIQGRDKFSVLSQELLKEANEALMNAEMTKSIIEEQNAQ
jgi:hypothetical protein